MWPFGKWRQDPPEKKEEHRGVFCIYCGRVLDPRFAFHFRIPGRYSCGNTTNDCPKPEGSDYL